MILRSQPVRFVFLVCVLVLLGSDLANAQVIKGQTVVFYERNHGTQVEYFAANGGAYLWYPGNTRIVQGRWRWAVDRSGQGASICFMFGSNTRNPVTGGRGGSWRCHAFANFWRGVKLLCRGDPFNLANSAGAVPYRLSRSRESLKTLRASCNRPT